MTTVEHPTEKESKDMTIRIELDGIYDRKTADTLVAQLDPERAAAAGMTIRILETLDMPTSEYVDEPEGSE